VRNLLFRIGELFMESLDKHCRTICGYRSLLDITNPKKLASYFKPKMDSYFLAETLKYLYLLFDFNNIIHTDHYLRENIVWTTEAHPLFLPRFPSSSIKSTCRTYQKCGNHDGPYLLKPCLYFDRSITDLTFNSHLLDLALPFVEAARLLGVLEQLLPYINGTIKPKSKGIQLLVKFNAIYGTKKSKAIPLKKPIPRILPTAKSIHMKPIEFPKSNS
jgi:hypothetical protein